MQMEWQTVKALIRLLLQEVKEQSDHSMFFLPRCVSPNTLDQYSKIQPKFIP